MNLQRISKLMGLQSYFPGPSFPNQPAFNQTAETVFDSNALGPKEVYLAWEISLKKPGISMNKKFIRTFVIIAIVLGLLLAIMQDFAVILAIGSVIFIYYVFSKYQLGEINVEISNHGIFYAERTYYWHELRNFFFSERLGPNVIAVNTNLGLPGRLFIDCTGQNMEKVKEILLQHLTLLKEEPKTSFDKAYDSLLSKFNLEDK